VIPVRNASTKSFFDSSNPEEVHLHSQYVPCRFTLNLRSIDFRPKLSENTNLLTKIAAKVVGEKPYVRTFRRHLKAVSESMQALGAEVTDCGMDADGQSKISIDVGQRATDASSLETFTTHLVLSLEPSHLREITETSSLRFAEKLIPNDDNSVIEGIVWVPTIPSEEDREEARSKSRRRSQDSV
jgi:hypothetical protein